MDTDQLPTIIQGGMGVGVSDWRLARAVSSMGQLGVVSGTGLELILVRSLQDGDADGRLRHALSRFPVPRIARAILERYFVAGGRASGTRYRSMPMPSSPLHPDLELLAIVAAFVQVFLAREGCAHPVGINLLEKIQVMTLPVLYGALLAGVGYVLMGAGVPRAIPGVLDRLAQGAPAELKLEVAGNGAAGPSSMRLDPAAFWDGPAPELERPRFLGIVASSSLARILARKSSGRVDGFVVEGPTAGGHNAPPRGGTSNGQVEPTYGKRDVVDLAEMRALGLPFWLAGSYGNAAGLRRAHREGAVGIQVGTAFAYCEESGIDSAIKARMLAASRAGRTSVRTDARASPTGFPFKVVELDDSVSQEGVYERRRRVCDVGYLRHAYRKPSGALGWRCPAEPVARYVAKGGAEADTVGRRCLCNGLLATVARGQALADGSIEPRIVTSGNEVKNVARFLRPGRSTYAAADVIADLLEGDASDA